MKPFILFLNGPENDAKRRLIASVRKNFEEQVCVNINRKELLKMFDAKKDINEESEESHEWIIPKVMKSIVNNGVFVVLDAFLPTRRINQYADQMKGLPCYWIGVFFKDYKSEEFYDFNVKISEEDEGDFEEQATSIFNFISNNKPNCFETTKEVEFVARKRFIRSTDSGVDSEVDSNEEGSLDDNRSNEEGSERRSDDRGRSEGRSEGRSFGGGDRGRPSFGGGDRKPFERREGSGDKSFSENNKTEQNSERVTKKTD